MLVRGVGMRQCHRRHLVFRDRLAFDVASGEMFQCVPFVFDPEEEGGYEGRFHRRRQIDFVQQQKGPPVPLVAVGAEQEVAVAKLADPGGNWQEPEPLFGLIHNFHQMHFR